MATKLEDLPLKTNHEVAWAHGRYILALQRSSTMMDKIPHTTVPGPRETPTVPFMIEAPLSSVEVLEALLKPPEPFTIYTARHIPRGCVTTTGGPQCCLPEYRRLYDEFMRFEGRLTKDREISFVCIPAEAIWDIRNAVGGAFWPVKLHYISIPWSYNPDNKNRHLEHPWALVMQHTPRPGSIYTYEYRFKNLLTWLGIPNCDFARSLLKPGTTPLPECVWDWFAGVPGKTAALPYYIQDSKEEGDNGEPKLGLVTAIKGAGDGGKASDESSSGNLENAKTKTQIKKRGIEFRPWDQLGVPPAPKRFKVETSEEGASETLNNPAATPLF